LAATVKQIVNIKEVFLWKKVKVKVKVKVKIMLRPTIQSAGLSLNKAPIWALRPDLYYCQTVAGLLMWSALSGERVSLSFVRLLFYDPTMAVRKSVTGGIYITIKYKIKNILL
jgi:hypothetical protein